MALLLNADENLPETTTVFNFIELNEWQQDGYNCFESRIACALHKNRYT